MKDETQTSKKRRVISVFVLAMLNVAIMASLRNLPLVASYGLSALFFFGIVGVFFLIPCALVSAELATGWSKGGGIYTWVREALGDRWGFFAIWMQWAHNLTWYPVILTFCASTFAFAIAPELAENKFYVIAVILVAYWGMTFLNFFGIKTSSWFSSIGVILGTILPGLFIIFLGVTWITQGNPIQTPISASAILPSFDNIGNFAFLAGLFLAFSGLEVSSAYASDVQNPQKNYPKAIILAAIITFSVFMLGSLAVAIVIPKAEISLVAGLMEAFKAFLANWHIGWLLPILAILLVIGAIAEVNAWIIGPVKGLYATSIHGNLPPIFQKVNKNGVATNLLLFQAIIVSITSMIILQLPTLSAAFWSLSAMSAQIYLVMYIMMFISAVRLRYSKPHVPRAYKVPYGSRGMWFFSILGIFACTFAIILSFFPPSQVDIGNIFVYESFLILSLGSMSAVPLIIYQMRKPHWFRKE